MGGDGGRIELDGEEIDPPSPRHAIDLGIGLLTRITSYNVCYTKLLRGLPLDMRNSPFIPRDGDVLRLIFPTRDLRRRKITLTDRRKHAGSEGQNSVR